MSMRLYTSLYSFECRLYYALVSTYIECTVVYTHVLKKPRESDGGSRRYSSSSCTTMSSGMGTMGAGQRAREAGTAPDGIAGDAGDDERGGG